MTAIYTALPTAIVITVYDSYIYCSTHCYCYHCTWQLHILLYPLLLLTLYMTTTYTALPTAVVNTVHDSYIYCTTHCYWYPCTWQLYILLYPLLLLLLYMLVYTVLTYINDVHCWVNHCSHCHFHSCAHHDKAVFTDFTALFTTMFTAVFMSFLCLTGVTVSPGSAAGNGHWSTRPICWGHSTDRRHQGAWCWRPALWSCHPLHTTRYRCL